MSGEAVRLRFPARPEYLRLARLAVTGVGERMSFGRSDLADLKLAVTEACSNTVRHAYAPGAPGEIDLELRIEDDRLELVVEDRGVGIELPVREVEPSVEGGMGLSIIRAVVDELEINPRAEGAGTVVHMTKRTAARDGVQACAEPEV